MNPRCASHVFIVTKETLVKHALDTFSAFLMDPGILNFLCRRAHDVCIFCYLVSSLIYAWHDTQTHSPAEAKGVLECRLLWSWL